MSRIFKNKSRRAAATTSSPTGQDPSPAAAPTDADRLAILKWHLDRYDRLRTSTVARASVVLSASAVLSAGNVLLVGQVLAATDGWLSERGWLIAVSIGITISALLVVASSTKAADVLLTWRSSRAVFPEVREIPLGPIFNGSDTVSNLKTFADYRAATHQGFGAMADAAEVDLWICIHQHRYRYSQLRIAVRLLRYAALAFLATLLFVLGVNLGYRA